MANNNQLCKFCSEAVQGTRSCCPFHFDATTERVVPSVASTHPTYQKPLPTDSIYKHLRMLANYCGEMGTADDKVVDRKEAFVRLAEKLDELAHGRYVKRLQHYGE